MYVAQVSSGFVKASGVTTFVFQTAEYLAKLGVRVIIHAETSEIESLKTQDRQLEVQSHSLMFAPSARPDVIHAHGLWIRSTHRSIAYAHKYGIPCVISPHGMLNTWALQNGKYKKLIAMFLYQWRDLKHATLFHATAPSEYENIRRLGFKQPVMIAPLGVNVPPEMPGERNNNPKIALFLSRVHPVKGLINLVVAWARIKPVGWKLVIAGPNEDGHAAVVFAKAHALGIDHDIEIVGPVYGAEKDALYEKADLFVLPTYSENFGAVIAESLSYGVPVITTKGAPWSDLVGKTDRGVAPHCRSDLAEREIAGCLDENTGRLSSDANNVLSERVSELEYSGRAGWWIDIGVEPLVDALHEAIGLMDCERYQMGINGRALVESKYTWPAVALQMKASYEWLLHGGRKPEFIML